MQFIKTNWPTAVALVVMVALFIMGNRGWLTSDQLSQIFALIGLGGMTGTRYMPAPSQSSAPETVRHITIPPKADP